MRLDWRSNSRRKPGEIWVELTQARDCTEKLLVDKGINLPDSDLDLDGLTVQNLTDLELCALCGYGWTFIRAKGYPECIHASQRLTKHLQNRNPMIILGGALTEPLYAGLPLRPATLASFTSPLHSGATFWLKEKQNLPITHSGSPLRLLVPSIRFMRLLTALFPGGTCAACQAAAAAGFYSVP
jgi:hypothetical protein